MKRTDSHWTDRFHKLLPSRDSLAAHPWLAPVASRLFDPQLWRPQHEVVAQILVATAHCTWWRANIPAAAAMTMRTNPLTIGLWLWLAYQTGARVMGEPLARAPPCDGALTWLTGFGWPTVLGMGMFAVGGAVALPGCQTDLAFAHLGQTTTVPVMALQAELSLEHFANKSFVDRYHVATQRDDSF